MKAFRRLTFILIGLALSLVSFGQDDWEDNTGEIESVEVEIIKDREIVLLKANRNFEKINPPFTPTTLPKFTYEFQTFDFDIPDLTFKLRPLRIKNEPLVKLYGGYLKAGFGNFGTPYIEGYVNNKRDQNYTFGVHAKHLSSNNGPVDEENSGVSETQLDLFGKVFTKKAVLGGSLGYGLDKVHFYGYPDASVVIAEDIAQQFNKLNVNGFVKSNSSTDKTNYMLEIGYQNISDDFSAKEGIFSSDLDVTYPISNESKFELNTDIQVISRKDVIVSDNRLVVSAKPTYQFEYNSFKIEAGINMAYENDTLQDMGKFHLYPVLQAAYDISEQVVLYAGIDGGVVSNTYHSAVATTPFVSADVPISHTNRLYQFTGGVRAKAGKSSYLHTGFSMGAYKHYQYLMNDLIDASRFTFMYDPENSTVADMFMEWGLSKTNQIQLSLRGDYFIYNMGSLTDIVHQPQYRIVALAKYNIYDKIIVDANINVLGGIKAIDNVSNALIDLDTAFDLSIMGTYLLSDQFSLFAKFNNVFSQEYQLINRYPVKGFQAMGGISYTF